MAKMNEFEKYYEMSEKTGWRVNDLNWDKIDKQNISELDKQIILATAVIEHGVPHYTETWTKVKGIEKEWELFTSKPTEGAVTGWTNTYLCY